MCHGADRRRRGGAAKQERIAMTKKARSAAAKNSKSLKVDYASSIPDVVEAQLETQNQVSEADYEAAAARRDGLVAGLPPRGRVHCRLAMGILDRLLSPVR
jgi:hypothetical protein